jgi:mRNA interferase MazF
MTASRVGDVVSVEFPFTDMQGRKRRPGVVLAGDTSDLLLARITTHEPRDSFDVQLDDWTIAGLPKPSTVRLMKLAALDVRLIHHASVRFRQAIVRNSPKRSSEWGFRLRKPCASNCVLILNARLAELLGGLNDVQE